MSNKAELELLRAQLAQQRIFNRDLTIELKTAKVSKDRVSDRIGTITRTQPAKRERSIEDGIEVSRWMRHPTCPFCGLEDGGKEAAVRPTEIHMLNCRARPLMDVPTIREPTGDKDKDGKWIYIDVPRKGAFIGEALQQQLRIPVRRMFKFTPRDPKTKLITGDDIWICSYKWKAVEGVVHRVWDGEQFVEWFKWIRPEEKQATQRAPLPLLEARWLQGFVKGTKLPEPTE